MDPPVENEAQDFSESCEIEGGLDGDLLTEIIGARMGETNKAKETEISATGAHAHPVAKEVATGAHAHPNGVPGSELGGRKVKRGYRNPPVTTTNCDTDLQETIQAVLNDPIINDWLSKSDPEKMASKNKDNYDPTAMAARYAIGDSSNNNGETGTRRRAAGETKKVPAATRVSKKAIIGMQAELELSPPPGGLSRHIRASGSGAFPGAFACTPISTRQRTLRQETESDISEASYEDDEDDLNTATDAVVDLEAPVPLEATIADHTDRTGLEDEEEDGGFYIVNAEPMDAKFVTIGFFKTRKGGIITFFVILLIAGIITSLVMLLRTKSDSPGSPAPTEELATTKAPALQFTVDMLPDFTQQAIASDPDSPQAKAWQWLQMDPFLYYTTTNPTRTIQRYALAVFYYSTLGPTHWTQDDLWLHHTENECDWWTKKEHGVDHDKLTCTMAGEFLQLELAQSALGGTLPPELSLLSASLEGINLVENHIGGTLPSELGLLTKLTTLNLKENNLGGMIPPEIFNLSTLNQFSLEKNAIGGTISTLIGQLGQLTFLDLPLNRFTGSLPSEVALMTSLKWVHLEGNRFRGTLPLFAATTPLQQLWLNNNHFTGLIQTELGLLTNLFVLRMAQNHFSGEVPTQIGLLTKLDTLHLSDNSFDTGRLHSELLSLPLLQHLQANDCHFTGTLPEEAWGLLHLESLQLKDNMLSGQIPAPNHDTRVTYVQLGGNQLSGTLPSGLGAMGRLQNLDLSDNQGIGGTLPSELGKLHGIATIQLNGNSFVGSIPMEVLDLANLKELSLHDNPMLTGDISSQFCQMHPSHDILSIDCDGNLSCSCCLCQ